MGKLLVLGLDCKGKSLINKLQLKPSRLEYAASTRIIILEITKLMRIFKGMDKLSDAELELYLELHYNNREELYHKILNFAIRNISKIHEIVKGEIIQQGGKDPNELKYTNLDLSPISINSNSKYGIITLSTFNEPDDPDTERLILDFPNNNEYTYVENDLNKFRKALSESDYLVINESGTPLTLTPTRINLMTERTKELLVEILKSIFGFSMSVIDVEEVNN